MWQFVVPTQEVVNSFMLNPYKNALIHVVYIYGRQPICPIDFYVV